MLEKSAVENVVLFPDSGRTILPKDGRFKVLETSDMKKAVQFAFDITPGGAVCLLSTASPSYSIWKNFEEQGDEFQMLVREMGKSSKV